jgi:hypothetical protein
VTYPTLGFDPAPGDVAAIREVATTTRRTATRIAETRDALRRIGTDTGYWRGKAATEFIGKVGELPGYLERADSSSAEALRALESWLNDLTEFQRNARSYEDEAASTRAELERARALRDRLRAQESAAASEEERQQLRDEFQRAQAQVDRLDTAFSRVLDSAHRLADHHDARAREVAQLIRAAADHAPPEPGFFERVGDALSDLVDFVASIPDEIWEWVKENKYLIAALADVFSDISTILGITAIFLPFPANLIVGGIAAASAVLALGGHTLAAAAGAEIHPLTFVADIVGVASFGAGAIGTLGVRGSRIALAGYEATGAAGGIKIAGENIAYYSNFEAVGAWLGFGGPTAGAGGTALGGGVPFENWVPDTPGEAVLGAVSPAGLAFVNGAQAGIERDRQENAQAERERWLR